MMAESTSKVLCKYVLSNACNKGASCEFSHDRSKHRPSNVCRHYLEGNCSYGSSCRYDHEKPLKKPTNKHQTASSAIPNRHSSSTHPPTHHSTSSHFTTLTTTISTNHTTSASSLATSTIKSSMPLSWALAPEFKPRNFQPVSYSNVLRNNIEGGADVNDGDKEGKVGNDGRSDGRSEEIKEVKNDGRSEGTSQFILCEYCYLYYNPTDPNHQRDCERAMDRHRRKSAVVEVSSKQTCGICLDVVWQKEPVSRQRFGLLSGCNHVFCLDCIRTWRNNNSADDDALRACPECRTHTDFVVPSYHWFVDQEDKDHIINNYKTALKSKSCKYFAESETCPFGDSCFYSHPGRDGKQVLNVKKSRRYKVDDGGDASVILTHLLSEFIQIEEALRDYVDSVDGLTDDDSDLDSDDDIEFYFG